MAEEFSPYGQDEIEALLWFKKTVEEVNASLLQIAQEVNLPLEFVSTLPTFENNNWVTYPELDRLLIKKMKRIQEKRTNKNFVLRFKRSLFGITLEFFFSLSVLPVFTYNHKNSSRLLVFTYEGISASDKSPGSIYWGNLYQWLEIGNQVTFISLQEARAPNTLFSRAGRAHLVETLIRMREFMRSIDVRFDYWRRIKRINANNEVFNILKMEFRRAIFGAPAWRSLLLSTAISAILLQSNAEKILTPFENQLWERLLFMKSREIGARTGGALHTLPRKWDLRYMPLQGRSAVFAPDRVIANGDASVQMLSELGVKKENILMGTALRFENSFGNPNDPEPIWGSHPRVLVALGLNEWLNVSLLGVLSRSKLKKSSITFRPHPASSARLLGKIRRAPKDSRSIEKIVADYDIIVTDSMASLAYEFASRGKIVFVYHAIGTLNHSPLTYSPSFRSYFSTHSELDKLLKSCAKSVEIRKLINTSDSRAKWIRILEEL